MLTETRKQKLKFILGKLGKALFTIWLVTTLIFFLIRLMPSNPVDVYVQQLITNYGFSMEEARARASTIFSIDLEASLFSQYISYLGGLLRGDLGESILSPGVKVTDIILKRLPWTLFTVGLGLLISFVIGTFKFVC
jgi:peptide/nickel transport system permease protein